MPQKRESDLACSRTCAQRPKNLLAFGGGVGLLAILLARAGLDVTLADRR